MENTSQDIKLVVEKLDLICNQIENTARSAITERNVQKILSVSNLYQGDLKYEEYRLVKDELSKIVEPKSIVQSIILYDYQGHLFDSGYIQEVTKTDTPIKMMDAQINQPKGEWKGTYRSNYRYNSYQQNIISFEQKFYNENNGVPLGVAVLNIDENFISKLYSEIKLGTTGNILIINSSGEVASSPHKETIYTSVKDERYYNLLNEKAGSSIFHTENGKTLVVYQKYDKLDWTIMGIVPVKEITKDNTILIHTVLLIFGLGIFISAAVILRLSNNLTKPLEKLGRVMNDVGEGDLEARAEVVYEDDVGLLALNFNEMLMHVNLLMDRLINEQKMQKKMEFSLIQAQINPHFLYNTLENICGLAQMKYTEDIIDLVSELAIFYRGILSKGTSIITVKDEIRITESYLNIMKTRFLKKFDYSIHMEPTLLPCKIMKLLLQPLVENSIHHGFRGKNEGGMIEITGNVLENKMELVVKDNGCGISKEDLRKIFEEPKEGSRSKSFGLKSVGDRVQLYFGKQYKITVDSVIGEGTTVRITLPMNELYGGQDDSSFSGGR